MFLFDFYHHSPVTARELPGDPTDLSCGHHPVCPRQEGFHQALILPMARDLFHHPTLLLFFSHRGTFLLLPLDPFHQTLLDNLDLFQFIQIHLFNQDLTLQYLLGSQNPYILINLNLQLKQLPNLQPQPLPLQNLPPLQLSPLPQNPPQQQPSPLLQNPPLLPRYPLH